jgi:hypothetical protein
VTRLDADRSTETILVPGPWLLGVWRFDREIDDRRNQLRGRATGEMIFTAEDDRIRWHETGTLSWCGARTTVTRTLFLIERGDGWIVTFDDGRDFHDWRPGAPVRHPCGADDYAGLIDANPESLIITWDVTGPAKDYTTTTRLTRYNAPTIGP